VYAVCVAKSGYWIFCVRYTVEGACEGSTPFDLDRYQGRSTFDSAEVNSVYQGMDRATGQGGAANLDEQAGWLSSPVR
tara:strand:- start:297 stop:530 length:234 start_codon:yes stop_codon:yes gene_type:complete